MLERGTLAAYGVEDWTFDGVFGLARAVWDSGGDRARARSLAMRARAQVEARAGTYGGRFKKQMDAVDAWLLQHR